MNRTSEFRVLKSGHVTHGKGIKTVCVSTVLNYLGISPDTYTYTSSHKNADAWIAVLQRNGYSVRSRNSEFGIKKYPTMTTFKHSLKKSDYTKDDRFLVSGYQAKTAHLMLLDGNGNMIIDTAPNSRWRIMEVRIVEKK